METNADILAARAKLFAKKGAASGAKIGGKGSIRRKAAKPHAPAPVDDKKLSTSLRKMGLNPIPSIEEVNFFKDNGKVLHFGGRPKVHTSLQSNTFSVAGHNEEKDIQELLPGILTQMMSGNGGMDQLSQLKKLAEDMQALQGKKPADDLDDIPDVGDFEAVSKEK